MAAPKDETTQDAAKTQEMPPEYPASPQDAAAKHDGGRTFRVLHDAIGPGWNIFTKGQVVREADLKHDIGGANGLVTYAWDIDRLLALGAIEETNVAPTDSQGEQFAPMPMLPEGKAAPEGGVPATPPEG